MTKHISAVALAAVLALVSPYSPGAFAQGTATKAVLTPVSDLKWIGAGVPGVETAVVKGDMAKGASQFYLKYAAGFVAPVHHHSPDHYVTTVAGNLVLVVDGKEHRLPPGSYFAFTGKAKHAARCEGAEACVMFIDARGPWDVVLGKPKDGK
jgi:quercetin dioxygenase-like cupin family protein